MIAFALRNQALEGFGFGSYAFGLRQQAFTRFIEATAVPGTVEEAYAQRLFKRGNPAIDGALVDAQFAGRSQHAARAGSRQKDSYVVPIVHAASIMQFCKTGLQAFGLVRSRAGI